MRTDAISDTWYADVRLSRSAQLVLYLAPTVESSRTISPSVYGEVGLLLIILPLLATRLLATMLDLIPATPGSLNVGHLERTLGVFFVGYIFAGVIYGFTFFGAYMYYFQRLNDPWKNKVTVLLLWGIETANVCLLSDTLHHHFVDLFPYTIGIELITSPFCVQMLLSSVSIFVSQIFYALRSLADKTRPAIILSSMAITAATAALVLGIIMSVQLFQDKAFADMSRHHREVIVSLHFAFNIVSSVSTFFALPKSPRSASVVDDWLDNLVWLTISRGGLAVVIQVALLVVFISSPSHMYWIPFYLVSARLFAIGPIILLNSSIRSLQSSLESDVSAKVMPSHSVSPGASSNARTLLNSQNGGVLAINVSTTTRLENENNLGGVFETKARG